MTSKSLVRWLASIALISFSAAAYGALTENPKSMQKYVKAILKNPKGKKNARGAIHDVRAIMDSGNLWVFLGTPVPAAQDVGYRVWINLPDPKSVPQLVYIEAGAKTLQFHDPKTKQAKRVPAEESDTAEGIFVKIPQKELVSYLAEAKNLVLSDITAVDTHDTVLDSIPGGAGVITMK